VFDVGLDLFDVVDLEVQAGVRQRLFTVVAQ